VDTRPFVAYWSAISPFLGGSLAGPRRRFAKLRRVRHGLVMVAGEAGSVPAAAHSALCLQMLSLTACKTLGARARIQAFRRLRARFLNQVAGPGAGRREERQYIRYTIADLFQWHYFGSKDHVSCSKLSACTTERHQTSDTLHPGSSQIFGYLTVYSSTRKNISD